MTEVHAELKEVVKKIKQFSGKEFLKLNYWPFESVCLII